MKARILTHEELGEADKIQSVAFAYSLDREEVKKQLADPQKSRNTTVGCFNDQGVLTACLELPVFQARYEGKWVPMAGVGAVASLPEYRYGGAVRELFRFSLKKMREDGMVFSSLYPFSHPYYRKFGYELCQITPYYKIPAAALSGFRCACSVRMVQPEDSLAPLETVYGTWADRYNLAVKRESSHWRKLLGKDPYKERRYAYLLENEEGPLAYVVFQAEDQPHTKSGAVKELAFTGPQGLLQAMGFLYRLAAQYEWFTLPLPDGVPLATLMPECYDVTPSWGDEPMARILQVVEALQAKAPGPGKSYTVQVTDELLPENSGVFQVANRGGAVAVERMPEETQAGLSLDIGSLTQLCLGTLSLEEALYKPEVRLAGDRSALEQAFPKKTVYLNEHF